MLPELQERDATGDVAVIYANTYRKTSPEMVVFGRMLGDALPQPGPGERTTS